jgi:hypothetical protein
LLVVEACAFFEACSVSEVGAEAGVVDTVG